MPLFKKDLNKKFTPTSAKFSDVYKYATNSKRVPRNVKRELQASMIANGYRQIQITKALNDEELSIRRLKELAEQLNKKKIYGFKKSGASVIDNYIQHQITKRKSINRRIREGRAEAMNEILTPMDKPIKIDRGSGRIPPSTKLKI